MLSGVFLMNHLKVTQCIQIQYVVIFGSFHCICCASSKLCPVHVCSSIFLFCKMQPVLQGKQCTDPNPSCQLDIRIVYTTAVSMLMKMHLHCLILSSAEQEEPQFEMDIWGSCKGVCNLPVFISVTVVLDFSVTYDSLTPLWLSSLSGCKYCCV